MLLLFSLLVIDCGPLDEPKNGFASSNGTVVGDTATYNCNPGFVLEPEEGNMRVCTHSGKWTGSVPECRSMCINYQLTCQLSFLSVVLV